MSYGYNTSLVGRTIDDTLLDYRRQLVAQLENTRSSPEVIRDNFHHSRIKSNTICKEKTRPIIFIGHSFGGNLILLVTLLIMNVSVIFTELSRRWLSRSANRIKDTFSTQLGLYSSLELRIEGCRQQN